MNIGSFIVYIVIPVVIIAFLIMAYFSGRKNQSRQLAEILSSQGFEPTINLGKLLIDDNHNLWYVKNVGMLEPLPLESIVDCEINENGKFYKTDNNGVIRALVGGAVFGNVGAMVGAVTATAKTTENIKLSLIIHTSNKQYSKITVPILDQPVSKSSALYQQCVKTAESMVNYIDSISDFSGRMSQISNVQAASLSGADEIAKYKSLLDSGAITQEEFDQAKSKILKL